jgi:acyl-coenzyme A thioesterase PaaI-like protein
MRFYWDGEQVVSIWKANPNYVSWIDTLHGGIQATLLDEICGWVVFYQLQTSCVTAKMELRYRKPVSTLWPYIRLNARLIEQQHKLVTIHGEILSPDGVCCAECTCTYFVFTGEKALEMGYIPAILDEKEVTLEEAIEHATTAANTYVQLRPKL